MNFLTSWFSKPAINPKLPVLVDMHSHLLPELDDGADSIEASLEMIESMISLGYRKLIMTPHIMGDFYKNSRETIFPKLDMVRKAVSENGWEIQLDAAAEYYLDEWFFEKLKSGDILTMGDNYLLFETSYINEPSNLYEIIFEIKARGYKPILAHPERYTYLYSSFERFQEIYEKGVFFQLNMNSLSGYYSKTAKDIANKLIEKRMVDFIGTDCHGIRHVEALKKTMTNKSFSKLSGLPLKNDLLL